MEWRFRKLSHDFALIQRQRPEKKHNSSFSLQKKALNGGQGPSKNRRRRAWLQLILKGWMRQLRWAYFAANLFNLDLRTIGCVAVCWRCFCLFPTKIQWTEFKDWLEGMYLPWSSCVFVSGVCLRIRSELSHHFSPPFGRICVELFQPPNKQS